MLTLGLAGLVLTAAAQTVAPVTPVASQPSVSSHAQKKPAPSRPAHVQPREEAKPTWAEMTPQQQQVLTPLAATWSKLGEAHKRKWIALAQSYPQMPPAEQAKLRSRMAEWAVMSPQQRTQARLNFAETQKVPAHDKRAKWEAYQALPPEEKRKLAAGAPSVKTPQTAAAVKPVPAQKLATVPKAKSDSPSPRIAAAPGQVDTNTLLPQPAAGQTPPN